MWSQRRDSLIGDYEIKLREMEIETYSKIISVFRAKGHLSNDRRKLLKQISSFLNIPPERHRAEARKVSNDDFLADMALRLTGKDWSIDWCQEGKRIVPTPLRFPCETVCTPLADYVASLAAIGPHCIDSVNKIGESSSTSVEQDNITQSVPEGSEIKKNWMELFKSVSESRKRTNSVKSVSVQTVRKKVSPQDCTYCKRRKEMKKKKLSQKEENSADETSETEALEDSSKESKSESVKKLSVSESNCGNLIILPSGKKILVENSCDGSYEELSDSLSATIIAQEIEVETEPFQSLECKDVSDNESVPKFDEPVPSTSHHVNELESAGACAQTPTEAASIQSRVPRILSCGQRRPGVLKRPHKSMEFSSLHDVRQYEKRQRVEIEENENAVHIPDPTPSTSQSGIIARVSSDSDDSKEDTTSFDDDEDVEEEEEEEEDDDSLESSEVCNTVPKLVPIDLRYDKPLGDVLPSNPQALLEEAVTLPSETTDVNKLVQILSCSVSSQDDLSLSAANSSSQEVKTCIPKCTEDPLPLKIIKIYNGEKRVHGTIHLRSGNMKDFLNRLTSARVTQVLRKKNNEENQSMSGFNQETHMFLNKNVMEDANLIQESSIPLVNGHEEGHLTEDICTQPGSYSYVLENEIIDELKNKGVTHQVITDQKDAFINHPAMPGSKDESKETDQVVNGT